jgi:hypothetical protein
MSETMPNVAFSACGNTRENMTRAEAKDISLISQAKVVKAGVAGSWNCKSVAGVTCDPDDLKRMPSPVAFRL